MHREEMWSGLEHLHFCFSAFALLTTSVILCVCISTLPQARETCRSANGSLCHFSSTIWEVFFFFLNCIFYFIFLLYNIVLVLPYINMHLPRVYTCSPSWTPLPPPSPHHPSGSSQCTSPKLPVSCIEPGLAIHFLYDIIHVWCHSPKSYPPSTLPQSPKDCSIHLCLFCCLAYRVIVTIFLNSIYMC